MSISIGNELNPFGSQYQAKATAKSSETQAEELKGRLTSANLSDSSDEELMNVCKSFESYLVEQVLTKTKKTLAASEEDENTYMKMFGDKLYQSYAEQITENGEIGLAQQLFEAMKRDIGIQKKAEADSTAAVNAGAAVTTKKGEE